MTIRAICPGSAVWLILLMISCFWSAGILLFFTALISSFFVIFVCMFCLGGKPIQDLVPRRIEPFFY